jgi:hypothetical protein
VIVPHHYFMWDLVQRSSTLLTAEAYVQARDSVETGAPDYLFSRNLIRDWSSKVVHFGEHVAFDKPPLADAADSSQDWG